MVSEFPAHLRAYDFLFDNEGDLRDRPFVERRARLEALIGGLVRASMGRRSFDLQLGRNSPPRVTIRRRSVRERMPRHGCRAVRRPLGPELNKTWLNRLLIELLFMVGVDMTIKVFP
jgi:hypothetical protein